MHILFYKNFALAHSDVINVRPYATLDSVYK